MIDALPILIRFVGRKVIRQILISLGLLMAGHHCFALTPDDQIVARNLREAAIKGNRELVTQILSSHNLSLEKWYSPSDHPFFSQLSSVDLDVTKLNRLYFNYQSAMHSTRERILLLGTGVLPALRSRVLEIVHSDESTEGDHIPHHFQLKSLFQNLGADINRHDLRFSSLEELLNDPDLNKKVAMFIKEVKVIYAARRFGGFLVVEKFSHNWLGAMKGALSAQNPAVQSEVYFSESHNEGVEIEHAKQGLELVADFLLIHPEQTHVLIGDMRRAAKGLQNLWGGLQEVISTDNFRVQPSRISKKSRICIEALSGQQDLG